MKYYHYFLFLLLVTFFGTNFAHAATETIKIYPTDSGINLLYDQDGFTSWSLARNFSGTIDREPVLNEFSSQKAFRPFSYYRIYRSSIRFDTSIIPDDAVIQSATFNVYKKTGDNTSDTELVITKHTRASSTRVTKPDWILTNYFDEMARDSLKENQYTKIDLNATGINYLNKGGYTIIGALVDYDFDDIDPGYFDPRAVTFYSERAVGTSTDPYLEITYTVPEQEVDELILRYAPVLSFFKAGGLEETYFPMDVETFVTESALWEGESQTQLYDASELDWSQFEAAVGAGDTDTHYLAFSDPQSSGSIDLVAAREAYESLDDPHAVYYHIVNDSDYTVLQYWYFYAMNNWKEHGGVNDHEGDWESVFVFLDKDTKEPKYVAYSAHHNDGLAGDSLKQYSSVRRSWDSDEVDRSGDTVISYVALGSHANYPREGDHRVIANKYDRTSGAGLMLDTSTLLAGNEIQQNDPFWMSYEGLWGTDANEILSVGEDGPQGPAYSNVSGHRRFLEPVKWAGIDLIDYFEALGGELKATFEKAGVLMKFAAGLPEQAWIKVDPHEEIIFFGNVPEGVTLLPKFWDITSSLENGTFKAEVVFEYDEDIVQARGGEERTLRVFHHDPETEDWVPQVSVVDMERDTVSFTTNHFSRYAIGFTEPEIYVNDIFDRIITLIDTSDLFSPLKKHLISMAERLREVVGETDRRALTAKDRLLGVLNGVAHTRKYAEGFLPGELSELTSLVAQVSSFISTDGERE